MAKNDGLWGSSVKATDERALVASATLAASGAYTRSAAISLIGAKQIKLMIKYDPAAGSGNVSILPLVSNDPTAAIDADVWYGIGQLASPIVVPAALAGSLATNSDFGATPAPFPTVYGMQNITLTAATGTASDSRLVIPINVEGHVRFHIQYAENGATGSPGTFACSYILVGG